MSRSVVRFLFFALFFTPLTPLFSMEPILSDKEEEESPTITFVLGPNRDGQVNKDLFSTFTVAFEKGSGTDRIQAGFRKGLLKRVLSSFSPKKVYKDEAIKSKVLAIFGKTFNKNKPEAYLHYGFESSDNYEPNKDLDLLNKKSPDKLERSLASYGYRVTRLKDKIIAPTLGAICLYVRDELKKGNGSGKASSSALGDDQQLFQGTPSNETLTTSPQVDSATNLSRWQWVLSLSVVSSFVLLLAGASYYYFVPKKKEAVQEEAVQEKEKKEVVLASHP